MRLEWIFLMQVVLGILMLFFLQKLMEIKKQIDKITKEVTNYISYITQEEEETLEEENPVGKVPLAKEKEEAQNRLIQAVLGEYFP